MTLLQTEGQLLSLAKRGIGGSPSWSTVGRIDTKILDALFTDYAAIYRTQPNVRTVVSFRARNVAQVGLHAFRRKSDKERERLPSEHPLSQLISSPNEYTSRYVWLESVDSDLGTYGNHFAVKVKRSDNGNLGLYRVPPRNVSLASGSWLRPEVYLLNAGNGKIEVPAERMFHIAEFNPDDPRWGLSPLETLRRILAEDTEAGKYREKFWRNKARIEGILQHPQKLSDAAFKRLRTSFKDLYTGEEASGETAILEEGMVFKEVSFNAKDSQYLEARKLSREEVAAAYHISPGMVGILEHANFSNMNMQHRMLYQDMLGPRFVFIEDEFHRQVLPDVEDTDDVYVEFNIAEKLKGSFEEQMKSLQGAVGAPWMLREEARAFMNLNALTPAQAEQLVTPLNVLIGGQASPLDSSPEKALLAAFAAVLEPYRSNGNGSPEKVRTGKED